VGCGGDHVPGLRREAVDQRRADGQGRGLPVGGRSGNEGEGFCCCCCYGATEEVVDVYGNFRKRARVGLDWLLEGIGFSFFSLCARFRGALYSYRCILFVWPSGRYKSRRWECHFI
jgi:hypothetical protein